MKELNVKCDNAKEAKFIENYLFKKGYRWRVMKNNSIDYDNLNYSIVIYISSDVKNIIKWAEFSWFNFFNLDNNKITDAKHIMREEKLKRINKV